MGCGTSITIGGSASMPVAQAALPVVQVAPPISTFVSAMGDFGDPILGGDYEEEERYWERVVNSKRLIPHPLVFVEIKRPSSWAKKSSKGL